MKSTNTGSRAYREAQTDDLWGTVWQIWPNALTYEEATPFDRFSRRSRRRKATAGKS